jgi:hypothetical protein
LGERKLVAVGDVAEEILDDERHFDERVPGSVVRVIYRATPLPAV